MIDKGISMLLELGEEMKNILGDLEGENIKDREGAFLRKIGRMDSKIREIEEKYKGGGNINGRLIELKEKMRPLKEKQLEIEKNNVDLVSYSTDAGKDDDSYYDAMLMLMLIARVKMMMKRAKNLLYEIVIVRKNSLLQFVFNLLMLTYCPVFYFM